MKVKFSNTAVDIWKLRKGVVICYEGHFVHLRSIGSVDMIGGNIIVNLEMDGGVWAYSDSITWLEPH